MSSYFFCHKNAQRLGWFTLSEIFRAPFYSAGKSANSSFCNRQRRKSRKSFVNRENHKCQGQLWFTRGSDNKWLGGLLNFSGQRLRLGYPSGRNTYIFKTSVGKTLNYIKSNLFSKSIVIAGLFTIPHGIIFC